jgi:hypothetical protein
MSDWYLIRDKSGRLAISMLSGSPMILGKSLAEETRADLDFLHPSCAPHRLEAIAHQSNAKPVCRCATQMEIVTCEINCDKGVSAATTEATCERSRS